MELRFEQADEKNIKSSYATTTSASRGCFRPRTPIPEFDVHVSRPGQQDEENATSEGTAREHGENIIRSGGQGKYSLSQMYVLLSLLVCFVLINHQEP